VKGMEPMKQGAFAFGLIWVDLCKVCGKPERGHHHLSADAEAIVKELKRTEPKPTGENLSLKALAVHSGLSERTLRTLIAAPVNPIPHQRVGRRVLVKRVDFDVWIAQHRKVGSDIEERIEQMKKRTRRHRKPPASRRAT